MLKLNQVYQGDCLEVMQDIDNESIDLTITSPPYDKLRTYNGNLKWTEEIWQNIIQELYRVTKKGGVVVWIVGDSTIKGSETGTSFKQALYFKECGFNLHDTMIFQKSGFSNPSTNRYHQVFEYMFVFSKTQPKTINPIVDRKNLYRSGGGASFRTIEGDIVKTDRAKTRSEFGKRYNIWRYPNGGGHIGSVHPAQFPNKLAEDHIYSWSNENDLILDPMAGSGTTGVAAQNLGRDYILIEKEPEYVEICKRRLAKTGFGL